MSTASTRETKEFFIGGTGRCPAAAGAPSTSEDGVSATVCINDGDTHNSPNEQTEAKFPIVVERYALIPDSGGAGKFRGGLGRRARRRARARHITVNSQIDRVALQALGARTAASRRPATRWPCASTANGRKISPTPNSSSS